MTPRELAAAVAAGTVVKTRRGRFAVPVVGEATLAADRVAGVVSHLSAALHWGWAVKSPPAEPWVTVPRKRKVPPDRRRGLRVVWADLEPGDIDGQVTSVRRTLADCLRHLPYDEASCVADSALRMGSMTETGLAQIAAEVTGPGAARARRVAAKASGHSANPFDACLRAIADDVPGLSVVPQPEMVVDGVTVHPDLVDVRNRIIIEAESFTFHGSRAALTRDCVRYNAFVIAGWRVVRFSWEQVLFEPAYVRTVLRALVRACPPVT